MLTTILLVVGGVLAGVIATLKVIAPLTKTTKDDKALEYAEDAAKVVAEVAPAAAAK